jgi:hypothetical protein
MPHLTKAHLAAGGDAQKQVDVKLSDGEFVWNPSWVREIGGGDPELGHRRIDEWILKKRKELIEHEKALPDPVGFKK